MKDEIFIDTSGFYSLLVKNDPHHEKARKILNNSAKRRRHFVTSDYVLDEISTLLLARKHGHLISEFFDIIFMSDAILVEWMDSERFLQVRNIFVKHLDQGWSFTDCLSFQLMKARRIRKALTTDSHFQQAGFTTMLK